MIKHYFSSRGNKHFVAVYEERGAQGIVRWFETEDVDAWGSISSTLSEADLLDWATRFAHKWGSKYLVKMRRRDSNNIGDNFHESEELTLEEMKEIA